MRRLAGILLVCACTGQDPATEPLPTPSTPTDSAPPPTEPTEPEMGFCAVRTLFQAECLLCHSAAARLGGLDLQTDPYAALVDGGLVAPGDPDGSLLVRKLEGTQGAGEGDPMPPSALLDPADQQLVRDWVAEGAPEGCEGTTEPTEPPPRHHPKGYDAPTVHGMDFKLQVDDCTTCHGEQLDGGKIGVSCASCHPADWTTTCTFCHGDAATDNPAPPEDIDDNADPATISFPQHTVHVLGDEHDPVHAGWDCVECHLKPESVFSAGHVLVSETTPGLAEVDFSSPGARAPSAAYTPGVGCANVWCHGTGQDGGEGTIALTDTVVCGGCHPVATHRDEMSGAHLRHLQLGQTCEDCHATAATQPYRIVDFGLHINGTRDVVLPAGVTWQANDTCDGSCHSYAHSSSAW